MNEAQTGSSSALFGRRRHTSVSRGLGEFRGRRPVFITAKAEKLLALPVEGLDRLRLAEFTALCGPVEPQLIVTERRALALGLDASTSMALQLPAGADAATILALVTDATNNRKPSAKLASPAATAAIHLVKISQSLPAVLAANLAAHTIACEENVVSVEADAVVDFADHATRSLTIASEASVPLSSGTSTRFIVFQDAVGDSQAAIIVGKPDFANPVPVRLHSACLTGDVFGSRRCDCGDQLRLALARIEELGGGVILYLAQEGRGLGLANKMRTYQLQDEGLDTDANATLGFDDDERDYGVAAHMLRMLNCTRIVLLTNNPTKLDGLTTAGIEIAGRMQIDAPINADNRRYMKAKAARAEHRLDHLMASLTDQS
ncbi:MAG TPA: GTP cyclohydrolase II RibA [Mesorhizobium sp.]|nr:GTP cyclohydrolase II RibA [Mesorhizobium sp.]